MPEEHTRQETLATQRRSEIFVVAAGLSLFCHDTSGHGRNPIYTKKSDVSSCTESGREVDYRTTRDLALVAAAVRESAFGRPIRSNAIIQSPLSLSLSFYFYRRFAPYRSPYEPAWSIRVEKEKGRWNIKSQRGINPAHVTLFFLSLSASPSPVWVDGRPPHEMLRVA